MTRSITAVVRTVDPDLPLDQIKTMDQLVHESLANDRFSTVLFASFRGSRPPARRHCIYGVMSFAVAQRTHEIGLRMALGAGPKQVLRLVLREGMLLALVGLAVGLAGNLLCRPFDENHVVSSERRRSAALSAVAAVLLLCALLACYIPARRATQVDPMVALRDE